MKQFPEPLDLRKVKVYPLAERQSLSAIDRILVDPDQPPRACDPAALASNSRVRREGRRRPPT